MPNNYIIGTRGSLLALTQCTQIKNKLEELTGDQFELKIIKTEGDENTSKPLWQLDGKDFFTKELDAALLQGEVDLVVHSYKDLGSERPEGIKLAAITERYHAEDILLFPKGLPEKKKENIIVGTSSPRRIVNLERGLPSIFPHNPKVKTENLRGNVNTRIEKLRTGNYDAICLALAGIERLSQSPDSLKELEKLLDGLDFMVLPSTLLPSAASQGALGIECLETRTDLLPKLQTVHHEETAIEMRSERAAFQSYGGGCHLAVGIQANLADGKIIRVEKGESDGKVIDQITIEGNELDVQKPLFIGMNDQEVSEDDTYDKLVLKESYEAEESLSEKANLFVSSRHCLVTLEKYQDHPLFCSGASTMKRLARAGFLVHGAADYRGVASITEITRSKAVQLMLGGDFSWKVLTNDESKSELGDTIACYRRKLGEVDAGYEEELKKINSFFWTSFPQYKIFVEKYPFIKDKKHFCGLGKTLKAFSAEGIQVTPVPSIKEFKEAAK